MRPNKNNRGDENYLKKMEREVKEREEEKLWRREKRKFVIKKGRVRKFVGGIGEERRRVFFNFKKII